MLQLDSMLSTIKLITVKLQHLAVICVGVALPFYPVAVDTLFIFIKGTRT